MSQSKFYPLMKAVLTWTFIVLFGTFFIIQGIFKLAPGSPWPAIFEKYGYPANFDLIIGVLEFFGGILLLIPRSSGYGALILGTVMMGACVTHLTYGETPQAAFTFALSLILVFLAYVRRPSRIDELRRARQERSSDAAPI